jgi:hypothetical protein
MDHSWQLRTHLARLVVPRFAGHGRANAETEHNIEHGIVLDYVLAPAELAEMAQDLLPVLRDLFPGLTTAAQRFVVMLIQRQALRLADDLDGGNSLREWDQGGPASIASPDFSKQRLIGNKRHPQVF